MDKQHPEWKVWTEFVVNDCQAGLGLDALRSSHPIEVPVKSPTEISQIFDSISYSKGASIIRMLVGWLGEDVFKRGIQSYLEKFKFGNARTEDLWTSLSEASGKPVNEMMGGWTKHIGYPVLDVERTGPDSCKFTQRRFLASGNVAAEEDQMVWTVPLFLPGSDAVLAEKSAVLKTPSGHFKVNFNQHGFYRVNYPSEWLEGLPLENLKEPVDRLALISDVHSLSIAGDKDMTDFMNLVVRYKQEDNYFVWCELLDRLHSVLGLVWEQDHLYDQVKSLIKWLTEDLADKLGFEYNNPNEDDLTKLLRQRVIASAGACGNEKVIEEAKRRFNDFVNGKEDRLHPNLRGTVYSIVLREGGVEEYERVLELYKKLETPDQKLAALGALGSTKNLELLKRSLQSTTDTSLIRSQDAIYIFRTVGANKFGRRLTWSFVEENWGVFYARYQKGGFSLLSRIVTSATDGFTSEKDAKQVDLFFKGRPEEEQKGIERALAQSLERIHTNTKCLLVNSSKLQAWFEKNGLALLKRV